MTGHAENQNTEHLLRLQKTSQVCLVLGGSSHELLNLRFQFLFISSMKFIDLFQIHKGTEGFIDASAAKASKCQGVLCLIE